MSALSVTSYQRRIAELLQYGGSANEDSIRKAFARLLDDLARTHDLRLIEELEFVTTSGSKVYPDGTLKDALRLPHGYWEAKDQFDDLDQEIATKRNKGYPTDNIIFEDSRVAVLIQNGAELMRADLSGPPEPISRLLNSFIAFERPEVANFRRAIEKFKEDLPKVLDALRDMFERERRTSVGLASALATFLTLCRTSINSSVTDEDVREMLLQHILTEDIFLRVFGDSQFHRENNIAEQLQRVAETFFTGSVKKNLLRRLDSYYGAIREAAAGIADHHEKQQFLKAIYENFYKVYNPKLADRLGVVYTPGEIVRFMLDGVDSLLHKHFGRTLASKNVEILDPAVGTGTFITDLIEHLKAHPSALQHKYRSEIHCNEVAILPYYIANLNIEFTYAQLSGVYEEFRHICFVDTLDNLAFEKTHTGQQLGLLGGLSAENTDRISKQNKQKISVIIGNPPYNANQISENDNNKNRVYEGIDLRIKNTWIAASNAQKTKLYDMYARFFRWAVDRINSDGVIAFITNRSFIDSRTFDGFRLEMVKEFDEIYILDLGGDVRANPKLSGSVHNVFGIQTGVAISFWVKKHRVARSKKPPALVYYARRLETETAADKLGWLSATSFADVTFEPITPDLKGNWINYGSNDFESLVPIANKETKASKSIAAERAVFKVFSLGISTNRDEWLYDFDADRLEGKVCALIEGYSAYVPKSAKFSNTIKWSETLKRRAETKAKEPYDRRRLRRAAYRPFVSKWLYQSQLFIDRPGAASTMFPGPQENWSICFSDVGSRADYVVLAVNGIADLHFGASVDAYQQVPLYLFQDAQRVDNITGWGLEKFRKHYKLEKATITREAIFDYIYGVLHDPVYREKYSGDLRRQFPRIPFYANFRLWSSWGQRLRQLHVGFEQAAVFPLTRIDSGAKLTGEKGSKPILKADKNKNLVQIDGRTTLAGVPADAWSYRLGSRCAIEWVLDQYKEAQAKDSGIRERFPPYRFTDYKEAVIELVCRVATVSVETINIIDAMRLADR